MQRVTRRFFIGAGATALLGSVGSPFGACGATVRRPKPSDRINLAVIGCGTMGRGNMEAFMQDPRVQVVAACDPVTELHDYGYSPKGRGWGGRIAFKRMVDEHYKGNVCRAVVDFREIADDPGIDAVCVTTPDHWHALTAIACMKKGKHVYCQKPMSLGISEGIAMTRTAKEMVRTGAIPPTARRERRRRTSRLTECGICGRDLPRTTRTTCSSPPSTVRCAGAQIPARAAA